MTKTRFYLSPVLLLLILSAASAALAEEVATLYSTQGTVEIRKAGTSDWVSGTPETRLEEDDTVRTSAASRAAIVLTSGVMIRLGELSLFHVELDQERTPGTLVLNQGEAHLLSRKPRQFPTIRTPIVSAAIRGTELTLRVSEEMSRIALLKGAVHLQNQYGELDLSGGELAEVKPGQAPVKSLLVNPAEEIQWTLYYPNLVSVTDLTDLIQGASSQETEGIFALSDHNPDKALSHFSDTGWRSTTGRALALAQKGQSDQALSLLASIPQPASASVHAALASLYLERGAVRQATAQHQLLEQSLSNLPEADQRRLRSVLLSQQAIIDLIENRTEKAASRAEEAQQLAPSSISAALTRSYIAQSDADLDGARKAIEATKDISRTDYNLVARQAELDLSYGESDEALEKATLAVEQMPYSAYALTVKGFAELARTELKDAENSFKRAIQLSQSDGLPYLGLGLVQIRQGELHQGRLLIQQAVHLEPQRSLYRSYLGKAFFEEELEDLAAEEYEQAIKLDPEDPTPYLYRSFHRTSTNRPVEALADLEKSISINDNRAVYRSSLMLDQDLGVRSNSLAQVYDMLGFSQVSRVEAIKSLSRDYSNHSAHLMLSQSYDGVDDLIQGSISEFFISRLLSPVSFNLIRPSQGGIVSSNEYNAVFDRNLTRKSVSLNGDTRDKSANPTVQVAGTDGRLGYGLIASGTWADGYRDNDSQNEQLVYGTLQYQLTPDDTILFDVNGTTFDNGDHDLTYDSRRNDPNIEQRFDDYLFRVGFNHHFSNQNILIGQVVRNQSNFRRDDHSFERLLQASLVNNGQVIDSARIDALLDQRVSFRSQGTRGDIQHIYNNDYISNVLGGGILDSSQRLGDYATVLDPAPLQGLPVFSRADNTEGSQRFFNYTTLHATSWLDIQGGISYSKLHLSGTPLAVPFQDSTSSLTKWDPKVGIVMTPLEKTTVRAAYFESIGSAGIRELELIEPTILSGFNQTFFDLFPGTASRNFAVGIDQKLDSGTYFGLEGLHRDLTRQFPLTFSSLSFDAQSAALVGQDVLVLDNDAHVDEQVAKGYVYQVLSRTTTATIDYQWNRDTDNFLDLEARTQRLRGGLNYFHPSGFLLFSRATWRDQRLSGYETYGTVSDGNQNFWIVDIGTGYRFHQRHGQITLTLNNILDQNFRYLPTGIDAPFLPGIGGSLAFSYNF